jgi:hypothetical protein
MIILIIKIWLIVGFLGYAIVEGFSIFEESLKGISILEYFLNKSLMDIIIIIGIILTGVISFIIMMIYLISKYQFLFKELWLVIKEFLNKPFKMYF